MMTRKHFARIADALRALRNSDEIAPRDMTAIVDAVADVCARSNARFDRARFAQATGGAAATRIAIAQPTRDHYMQQLAREAGDVFATRGIVAAYVMLARALRADTMLFRTAAFVRFCSDTPLGRAVLDMTDEEGKACNEAMKEEN